jgi:hypothetical protein
LLDRYLEAVIAHDPARAPLVVGFRQTENAINVAPGKGLWQSVTALGKVQRRYFDPVTGQAGYYGTVMEGNETAIVTLRLRVEDRQLTEAEWYVARADDPGMNGPRRAGGPPANLHNPEYLELHPPRQAAVPVRERADRATLGRAEWHGNHRLRVGAAELQRRDGGRAAHAAHRRGSAGRAGHGRLHPPAGIADTAPGFELVVRDRPGEDPHDVYGDVLSAGGACSAELAAVRRQLAAAGVDRTGAGAASLTK